MILKNIKINLAMISFLIFFNANALMLQYSTQSAHPIKHTDIKESDHSTLLCSKCHQKLLKHNDPIVVVYSAQNQFTYMIHSSCVSEIISSMQVLPEIKDTKSPPIRPNSKTNGWLVGTGLIATNAVLLEVARECIYLQCKQDLCVISNLPTPISALIIIGCTAIDIKVAYDAWSWIKNKFNF